MSASCLKAQDINSVMNSDQASRNLDERKGLSNFVRLSLNDKNPMQYVALKEKRVANLVMLQVNLQVVSRPGVLFSDCNATRTDAVRSRNPKVIRYDVVQQKDQFAVAPELRKFAKQKSSCPRPYRPISPFSRKKRASFRRAPYLKGKMAKMSPRYAKLGQRFIMSAATCMVNGSVNVGAHFASLEVPEAVRLVRRVSPHLGRVPLSKESSLFPLVGPDILMCKFVT